MEALLSPYFTLILSFLVLYKWILKLVYDFRWSHVGAVLSRFIFFVVYALVVTLNPPAEDLRELVRVGLNLLFIDEIINWGISARRQSNRLCQFLKGLIKRINGKQW